MIPGMERPPPSRARRWLYLIAAVLALLSLLIPLFLLLRGG
jgi:hypothetical protein